MTNLRIQKLFVIGSYFFISQIKKQQRMSVW